VIAVPLVARGRGWGTLDLYRHTPTVWTAAEQAAAQVLADVAVFYIVMAVDRDVASAARVQLSTLALTDQLTGLPNRALLLDRMTHALAVGRRTGQVNAAVFLDVDHFKAVNDSSGHAAGDAVLIEVARRMTSILRLGDTVARLGGDEFVLFCENIAGTSEEELRSSLDRITGRLRAVLQPPVALPGGVELPVKVSMGAALTTVALTATPAAATTATDLLAIADTALYEAKTQGRDRVVISEVRPPAAGDGWQLEWDLLGALDRGEFMVHYQPIIDAATGAVHAVEALLRWDHPQHGLLPAEAFLPLALANGTLPRVGRWLIDQACGHAHHWQQSTPRPPRVVFVTLSPPELTDPAVAGAVTDALRDHHLRPRHLGPVPLGPPRRPVRQGRPAADRGPARGPRRPDGSGRRAHHRSHPRPESDRRRGRRPSPGRPSHRRRLRPPPRLPRRPAHDRRPPQHPPDPTPLTGRRRQRVELTAPTPSAGVCGGAVMDQMTGRWVRTDVSPSTRRRRVPPGLTSR